MLVLVNFQVNMMKRIIIVLVTLFISHILLFPEESITISFLEVEGNMGKEFNTTLTPIIKDVLRDNSINVLDDRDIEKSNIKEEDPTTKEESGNSINKQTKASHILIVSANSWKEEEVKKEDILLSMLNTSLSTAADRPTYNLRLKKEKNIIEKYRISVKIIDIESSYIVATGMAQGFISDSPEYLSKNAINNVIKQLNRKKVRNRNPLSLACMPPEGSTNYMANESKLPYIIAVESAFINRGDKVGDRNKLETVINELVKQNETSRKIDPTGDMLKFGEIMQVSYFASVSVDTWIESRTSGLDIFNALSGTATAIASERSATYLGGEQSKDLIQKVRVTIKIIDIESSYVLAAGIAQGEISDNPEMIVNGAMKDLNKQLKNIEKRKKKILENPISVSCLPPYGSMEDGAKIAYISAIETSLIKSGYKVADRSRLKDVLEEIKRQRSRGSVIKGDALEIGKIMKITHFVYVTVDAWDEEGTSSLDVFKTVSSAATAALATETIKTRGGKESRDIIAHARVSVKIVGIEDGIILASGIEERKMKDNPSKLSGNILKQVTKQIKKVAKSKTDNDFFISSYIDGGSLDDKSKVAYITATEHVFINQGIKMGDSSIDDNIIGEELLTQRVLGSEDEEGVLPTKKENEKYIAYITVDTWEEERISELSIAKILLGVAVNTYAIASADENEDRSKNYHGYQPISEDDITTATTKHVSYKIRVVLAATNETIFTSNSSGKLKDNPVKIVNKALKNANKSILSYENNK